MRSALSVFVVLVFTVVLATARRAEAMCGHPSWIGTESSAIPTRGSVYVYDEIVEYRAHQHEVCWNGPPGIAVQTKVAEGGRANRLLGFRRQRARRERRRVSIDRRLAGAD